MTNSKFVQIGTLIIEVMSGGHAVERQTVNRGDGGSIPTAAVSKLGNFVHLTLPVSFGRH